MIFSDSQHVYIEGRARGLLSRLNEWRADELMQVNLIRDLCMETCLTGYAIARNEVQSSPWEYFTSLIGDTSLNEMSSEGWEPFMVFGEKQMIWRRRKGVKS